LYYQQQQLLQRLLLYSSINRQVFGNMEITSEFTMVTQPSDLCKPHMIASILFIYNFNVLRIMCKS
jgi:hypothetical protein